MNENEQTSIPNTSIEPADVIIKGLMSAEEAYLISNKADDINAIKTMEEIAKNIKTTACKLKGTRIYAHVPITENVNGIKILREKGYLVEQKETFKSYNASNQHVYCMIDWAGKEPRGDI